MILARLEQVLVGVFLVGEYRDIRPFRLRGVKFRQYDDVRGLLLPHELRNALGMVAAGDKRGDALAFFGHALDRIGEHDFVAFFGGRVEIHCHRHILEYRAQIVIAFNSNAVLLRCVAHERRDKGGIAGLDVACQVREIAVGELELEEVLHELHALRYLLQLPLVVVREKFFHDLVLETPGLFEDRGQVYRLVERDVVGIGDEVFVRLGRDARALRLLLEKYVVLALRHLARLEGERLQDDLLEVLLRRLFRECVYEPVTFAVRLREIYRLLELQRLDELREVLVPAVVGTGPLRERPDEFPALAERDLAVFVQDGICRKAFKLFAVYCILERP